MVSDRKYLVRKDLEEGSRGYLKAVY